MIESAAPPASAPDVTLAHYLRRLAFAQMPTSFYSMLQLSAPLAVQAWMAGWHRMGGLLFAVSCFGLWAIAEQRIAAYANVPVANLTRPSRRWTALRRSAAALGALSAGLVLAEAFAQFLATIFNCPGCAG